MNSGVHRAAAAALALAAGACGGGGDAAAPPRQGTRAAGTPAAAPGAESSTAAPAALPTGPRFVFTDIAESAGLRVVTWCGRPDKPHLLESGGNGLAVLDYDGDGRLDVYLVSGWRLDGERIVERTPNRLYRNLGDGTFEDTTERAGVGDEGWGTGVAVGDADGDGRPELFVTNFGKDVLFRNRGDGTFERTADPPGIDGWSAGACFFDADGDGDADLFVAGYVDCTLDEVLHAKPTLDWNGSNVMFGPFGLKGLANRWFRNDGGRFTEATAEAGLTDVGEYFSFGVAAFDFDDDLDLDLFVANDSNPNYVYRNDGGGKFTEVGLWCGAALSGPGAAQAGMGVGVGDYDGDLRPDVLVTNFADDVSTLYRNLGRGLFRDVTNDAGLREPTYKPLSWGVVFADFDLDGDEDLYIANGHIYPQADTTPLGRSTFAQRNLLLENTRADGAPSRYRDATTEAGPGLEVVRSSRGVAAGDLDGDGDVDLVVSNVDAAPTLLRNDAPRRGHWITVDAPGALRVTVETAGGRRQVRHFVAGGSFCSASDPRHHFGLADAVAARVTAVFAGGREVVIAAAPADRILSVAPPR